MPDNYSLERSETESARLDTQHRCWTKNIGYLVNPVIAEHLPSNSRIADIGTGTGIFLFDAAKQLPDACQLDGFDISASAFPADGDHPVNMHFDTQDAREPYPDKFHQLYDLVHLKLMVSGFDKDDWTVAAAHAISLLKPGGWIQWAEGDFLSSTFRIITQQENANGKFTGSGDSHDGISTPVPEILQEVCTEFHEATRHRLLYGFSTLKGIFEQQGLQDVTQDIVPSDKAPSVSTELTRGNIAGVLGWQRQLQKKGAPGAWTTEKMVTLKQEIEKEIENGGYERFHMYVTMGRKP